VAKDTVRSAPECSRWLKTTPNFRIPIGQTIMPPVLTGY
jgi:hypothetical protein